MKTTIINLYAGPGAGKSTLAAELFHQIKTTTNNLVELVLERAKEDAWHQRIPIQVDVFYEQARRVHRLIGKVDVVIIDSPIHLSGFYSGDLTWKTIALTLERIWESDGHEIKNFFITRTKPYKTAGRFETEEEAKKRCIDLKNYLDEFGILYWQGTGQQIKELVVK